MAHITKPRITLAVTSAQNLLLINVRFKRVMNDFIKLPSELLFGADGYWKTVFFICLIFRLYFYTTHHSFNLPTFYSSPFYRDSFT